MDHDVSQINRTSCEEKIIVINDARNIFVNSYISITHMVTRCMDGSLLRIQLKLNQNKQGLKIMLFNETMQYTNFVPLNRVLFKPCLFRFTLER